MTQILTKLKTFYTKYKTFLIDIIFIIILINILDNNYHAIWIILLYYIIFSIFAIYKNRIAFMLIVRQLETVVMGKTFDKGNWKKGEKSDRIKHLFNTIFSKEGKK